MKNLTTLLLIAFSLITINTYAQLDATTAKTSEQYLKEGVKVYEAERGWVGYKMTRNGKNIGRSEVYFDRYGLRQVWLTAKDGVKDGEFLEQRNVIDGDVIHGSNLTRALGSREILTEDNLVSYMSVTMQANYREAGKSWNMSGVDWKTEAWESTDVLGLECNGIRFSMAGKPYGINWYSKGLNLKTVNLPTMTKDQLWPGADAKIIEQLTSETVTEAIYFDVNKQFGEEVFAIDNTLKFAEIVKPGDEYRKILRDQGKSEAEIEKMTKKWLDNLEEINKNGW